MNISTDEGSAWSSTPLPSGITASTTGPGLAMAVDNLGTVYVAAAMNGLPTIFASKDEGKS